MRQYTLSDEAYEDLGDIFEYTLATWGARQAEIYTESLFDKFEILCLNPLMGIARPELRSGLRSALHQQHVIFYFLREDTIAVARILHGSRDFTKVPAW
jgi:toxin ParE1/3/4